MKKNKSYLKGCVLTASNCTPPEHVVDGLQYETIMGSRAYGTVIDDNADYDLYGFSVPPVELVYPHLQGVVPGFTKSWIAFEQYTQQVEKFDFSIYAVTKYFRLCADGNPNLIDSLFTPYDCVTFITEAGKAVRQNRELFLSKRAVYKFIGYANGEMKRLVKSATEPNINTRQGLIEAHGYDTKSAYHLIRVLLQAGQILRNKHINLVENAETLRAVRSGEYSLDFILTCANGQMAQLETLVERSTLPSRVHEGTIKGMLYGVLEEVYGSYDKARGLKL